MTEVNLSITEYAQMFGLSPHAVRNQVTTGELKAEKRGNKWMIQIDETEVPLNTNLNRLNKDLLEKLELHISDLQSTIEDLRANLEKKEDELLRQGNRIDELIKQQDQSQVIIMSMEKDRQLLVESRRSPFSKLLNFIGVGS